MAIRRNVKNKTKRKREPNWLLRLTIILIMIPLIILGYVVLTSLETKGEPVVGERFHKELDPKIKKEQIKELEESIKAAFSVESVEVNLKSATLRIVINMVDTDNTDVALAVADDVYKAKLQAVLPVETYFTNHDGIKMYDVEIHVYNFIPNETQKDGATYILYSKSGAATEPIVSNLRDMKNPEIIDSLLNPQIPEGFENKGE